MTHVLIKSTCLYELMGYNTIFKRKKLHFKLVFIVLLNNPPQEKKFNF